MTDHKNYKNESQDARRHDKHNAAHPDAKTHKKQEKSEQNRGKRK